MDDARFSDDVVFLIDPNCRLQYVLKIEEWELYEKELNFENPTSSTSKSPIDGL